MLSGVSLFFCNKVPLSSWEDICESPFDILN